MNLTTLKAHIKSGELDSFYIFTGPEVEVMRLYIEQLAKRCGATVKNLDSITNLTQKAHTRSMLQNRSIFILRDSREFISDDTLQSKITQNNAFGDDILIFVYSALDKRSKLYKNYKDHIVEFEPLKADILVKYIQRDIDLSEHKCRLLIDLCDNDYSRILLEIDKIRQYQNASVDHQWDGKEYIDTNQCFKNLVNDGTIYVPPKDAVFDFVDAVLRHHPHKAFQLLEESYACGEATLVLLSNLYNSAKQLLQVQAYDSHSNGKITEATGLTPFQVKLASGRKGVYTNGGLVALMRRVRQVEKGIKTGEIDEKLAVPYILVKTL